MNVEIRQMYYEDVEIGDKAVTEGRTISEADIVNFAGVSGDYNSLHVDAVFAANSIGGQRVAHGLLIWSVGQGLYTKSPYNMSLQRQMRAMSSVNIRFRKPVLIGDTIHVVQECIEKSDTRPGSTAAKIIYKRTIINQRGEEVQVGEVSYLIAKRPAEEATE